MDKLLLFINDNKWAILIIGAIGFVFFVLKAFRNTGRSIKRSYKTKGYANKLRAIAVKLYSKFLNFVSKIPVVGDIVGNISYSYQCHEALTDEEAAIRTGQTLLRALLVFVVTFAAGTFWFKNIILSTIVAFIFAHVAVVSLKSKPRKFLNGLRDATETFLLEYHKSSGNIDAAFHAVTRTKNPVARHFGIMYEYVKRAYTSPTPEAVQNAYNAVAPSRYLRNIYAIICMTYKYGDNKDESGRSALNNNLMEVQEQVGDILYQQNKIKDESMGERWFIIIPVLAIPLISKYMVQYFSFPGFEFINKFVNSSAGYMVSVLCTGIALICYLVYAKLSERGILEEKSNANWAKKALRYPLIRKITNKMLPPNSAKRKKMSTTIKKSGSSETVDAIQVKRMFIALALVVIAAISTGINYWQNTSAVRNDIYLGLPRTNYERILLTQDDTDAYVKDMLSADWKIVKYIQGVEGFNSLSEEDKENEIRTYMRSSTLIYKYRGYENDGITRIIAKYERLKDTSALNMLIFIAGMGVIGYFLPYGLIFLQAMMNREMLLIDETSDLQKMAIMLLEYP
ncbi:MAG: hypothetical protein GXY05_02620, partial [Clostridiales bacterium]|nr:hypothetical protein [Clostridiales bacterium]